MFYCEGLDKDILSVSQLSAEGIVCDFRVGTIKIDIKKYNGPGFEAPNNLVPPQHVVCIPMRLINGLYCIETEGEPSWVVSHNAACTPDFGRNPSRTPRDPH